MTFGEVIQAHLEVMKKIEKNLHELQQHADGWTIMYVRHSMDHAHFMVQNLEFLKASSWANLTEGKEITGDFTITP